MRGLPRFILREVKPVPDQDLSEISQALAAAQAGQPQAIIAVGERMPPPVKPASTAPDETARRVKAAMAAAVDEDIAALDELKDAIERTKQALIAHRAKFNEHADNTAQLRTNARQMVHVIGASLEGFAKKINGDTNA